ncbi:hypothetical protein [Variovorax sp. JS1663]|uniref:hypothetical protein n=1 Tax=Variovorax sp. JS1663 TaxID=1851577 RepID=UPI000B3443C1|nr:hypothetical protein [Variovorax sp. JS1663]OUM00733.1 hypothetical protein A8M77_19805 [Variovorax sp. JS1663]
MKNEYQFWQDLARTINPGWSVRVDPLSTNTAGATLAGNDVFIYVVDVANGWFGAGALLSSDAPKIATWASDQLAAESSILTVGSINTADVAGKAIALCGARGAGAADPEVAAAVGMTTAALQATQTYARAVPANRQRGESDMAGHWVYLAYRTRNGQGIITRPIWVSSVHPGIGRAGRFLDPSDLMLLVRTVVQSETASSQTMVGRGLAAEGGAIVSPKILAY